MSLPSIPASSSTVIPQMVYGSWWVSAFNVIGDDPSNVRVRAVLRKYGTNPEGDIIFSPTDEPVIIELGNVMAMTDPANPLFNANVSNVVLTLISNLYQYAQSQL